MTFSLKQVAELIGGQLEGDETRIINDVAEIQHAQGGQITFLGNLKYTKYLATTAAEAVIVPEDFKGHYKNLIRVKQPGYSFSQILHRLRPDFPLPEPGIHPRAVIAKKAKIGDNVYIGPNTVVEDAVVIGDDSVIFANSYIGNNVIIGKESIIYANASIYHHCIIGAKNIIHSGAVIGSDGFGFTRITQGISKIPQTGHVETGDDVEIGANSTIDRGTVGNTIIGKGTKLDNLVHVAHNVRIGKYCFFAGQVGMAGSAIIGDNVAVGGQSAITGHITVGAGVTIGGKSAATKDIAPGKFVFGFPAQDIKKAKREIVNIRQVPELKGRIKELENIIKKGEESEKTANN